MVFGSGFHYFDAIKILVIVRLVAAKIAFLQYMGYERIKKITILGMKGR